MTLPTLPYQKVHGQKSMSYLLQEDSEQPDDSGMEQKSSDGEDQRRKHGETDLRTGSGFGTGFRVQLLFLPCLLAVPVPRPIVQNKPHNN